MYALFKKELKSYAYTSPGYVFALVLLAVAAFVFYAGNMQTLSSDMSGYFSMLSYLWMLLCPVLVMRLISGERRQMTDRLIMTAPLTAGDIILSKYLASVVMLLLTATLSLFYPMLVSIFGYLHVPEVLTMYLGFFLLGCAFLAVDLMLSTFFANPNAALVMGLGANLLLWLSGLAASTSPGWLRQALGLVNLYDRFAPFLHGQLSPANIAFYVMFSALVLLLASLVLDQRRGGVQE